MTNISTPVVASFGTNSCQYSLYTNVDPRCFALRREAFCIYCDHLHTSSFHGNQLYFECARCERVNYSPSGANFDRGYYSLNCRRQADTTHFYCTSCCHVGKFNSTLPYQCICSQALYYFHDHDKLFPYITVSIKGQRECDIVNQAGSSSFLEDSENPFGTYPLESFLHDGEDIDFIDLTNVRFINCHDEIGSDLNDLRRVILSRFPSAWNMNTQALDSWCRDYASWALHQDLHPTLQKPFPDLPGECINQAGEDIKPEIGKLEDEIVDPDSPFSLYPEIIPDVPDEDLTVHYGLPPQLATFLKEPIRYYDKFLTYLKAETKDIFQPIAIRVRKRQLIDEPVSTMAILKSDYSVARKTQAICINTLNAMGLMEDSDMSARLIYQYVTVIAHIPGEPEPVRKKIIGHYFGWPENRPDFDVRLIPSEVDKFNPNFRIITDESYLFLVDTPRNLESFVRRVGLYDALHFSASHAIAAIRHVFLFPYEGKYYRFLAEENNFPNVLRNMSERNFMDLLVNSAPFPEIFRETTKYISKRILTNVDIVPDEKMANLQFMFGKKVVGDLFEFTTFTVGSVINSVLGVELPIELRVAMRDLSHLSSLIEHIKNLYFPTFKFDISSTKGYCDFDTQFFPYTKQDMISILLHQRLKIFIPSDSDTHTYGVDYKPYVLTGTVPKLCEIRFEKQDKMFVNLYAPLELPVIPGVVFIETNLRRPFGCTGKPPLNVGTDEFLLQTFKTSMIRYPYLNPVSRHGLVYYDYSQLLENHSGGIFMDETAYANIKQHSLRQFKYENRYYQVIKLTSPLEVTSADHEIITLALMVSCTTTPKGPVHEGLFVAFHSSQQKYSNFHPLKWAQTAIDFTVKKPIAYMTNFVMVSTGVGVKYVKPAVAVLYFSLIFLFALLMAKLIKKGFESINHSKRKVRNQAEEGELKNHQYASVTSNFALLMYNVLTLFVNEKDVRFIFSTGQAAGNVANILRILNPSKTINEALYDTFGNVIDENPSVESAEGVLHSVFSEMKEKHENAYFYRKLSNFEIIIQLVCIFGFLLGSYITYRIYMYGVRKVVQEEISKNNSIVNDKISSLYDIDPDIVLNEGKGRLSQHRAKAAGRSTGKAEHIEKAQKKSHEQREEDRALHNSLLEDKAEKKSKREHLLMLFKAPTNTSSLTKHVQYPDHAARMSIKSLLAYEIPVTVRIGTQIRDVNPRDQTPAIFERVLSLAKQLGEPVWAKVNGFDYHLEKNEAGIDYLFPPVEVVTNQAEFGSRMFRTSTVSKGLVNVRNPPLDLIANGFQLSIGGEGWIVTNSHLLHGLKFEHSKFELKELELYHDSGSTSVVSVKDDVSRDIAFLRPKNLIGCRSFVPYVKSSYKGPCAVFSRDGTELVVSFGICTIHDGILTHTAPTKGGSSGSPIFDEEYRVLGVHKGALDNVNVGRPMSEILAAFESKIVNQAIMKTASTRELLPHSLEVAIDEADIKKLRPYKILGIHPNFFGLKDKYVKSELFDTLAGPLKHIPHTSYAPAEVNLPNMLRNWVRNIELIPRDIDEDVWEHSFEILAQIYDRSCTSYNVLTFDDAVSRLTRSSSVGHLFGTLGSTKGYVIEHHLPELRQWVQDVLDGKNPNTYYKVSPKYCIDTVTRVEQGKVRSFCAAGIEMIILQTMLFGEFFDYLAMSPPNVTHSLAGMSPYRGGWDESFKEIRKAPYIHSNIDTPKWDAKVDAKSKMMWYGIVLSRANHPHHSSREFHNMCTYNEAKSCHPTYAVPYSQRNVVLVWTDGNTVSGELVTFLLNCGINSVRVIYAKCKVEEKKLSLAVIESELKWRVCGDDLVFGYYSHSFRVDLFYIYMNNTGLIVDFKDPPYVGKDFIFAGVKDYPLDLNGHALYVPVLDPGKFIAALEYKTTSASLADYFSAICAYIRLSCISSPEISLALYRFALLILSRFETEISSARNQLVSPEQAVLQYLPRNESSVTDILDKPRAAESEIIHYTALCLAQPFEIPFLMSDVKRRNNRPKSKASLPSKTIRKDVDSLAKIRRDLEKTRLTSRPRPKAPRRASRPINRGINEVSGGIESQIIQTIALPGNQLPTRFSDQYSTASTAVSVPWSEISIPNQLTTPDPDFPDTGSGAVCLFRNDLRSMVYYDPNAGAASYAYQYMFWNGQTSNPTLSTFTPTMADFLVPVTPSYTSSLSTTYQPHGESLYCGSDPSNPKRRYVWLDAGVTITFQGAAFAGSGTINFYSSRYVDGVAIDSSAAIATLSSTGPTLSDSYIILTSGYYYFQAQFSALTTSLGSFQVTFSGDGPVWCHLPIPHLESKITSVTSIRMLGISLCYTNTSNMLNRGGNCAMKQFSSSQSWDSLMNTATPYNTIAKQQGANFIEAKNGMYGFLKPGSASDYEMRLSYDISFGKIADSYFPLSGRDTWLAFAYDIPTSDGQLGYYTHHVSCEFTTGDTWFGVSTPSYSPELFLKAMGKIRSIKQFHENPTHLREILGQAGNLIKKGFGFARKYGPIVSEVGSMFGI